MGDGNSGESDRVAVDAMRRALDSVPMDATIVIAEGERDRTARFDPGERVGLAHLDGDNAARLQGFTEVELAVDPLEGAELCAKGIANAVSVLAASDRGGLLRAPDIVYMEKLIVGPGAKGLVHLDAPVSDNLAAVARSLNRDIAELVVVVLDRPRNQGVIDKIRNTRARIQLISDGDLSAGIAVAVGGSGVHAVMGSGGVAEGVLTAAAMRCLNGEILGRLIVKKPEEEKACTQMGITDFGRIYRSKDLAPGDNIIFAATGVTNGSLLKGVRFFGEGARTSSVVMQGQPGLVRFVDTIHVTSTGEVKIRF